MEALSNDVQVEREAHNMPGRGVIMVLGSPNDAHGRLYSVALGRCEEAVRLWCDNPDWKVLLTGGYGDHFNTTNHPHAHYVKECLLGQGLPSEAFLELAGSRNTLEDASLAKPILLNHGATAVVVVTSDYHLARARFVFGEEFAGTGIVFLFIGVPTDDRECELDLRGLRKHEREALSALMAKSKARRPPSGK